MIFLSCNQDCLLPAVFQLLKWLLSTSWTMSKFHDVWCHEASGDLASILPPAFACLWCALCRYIPSATQFTECLECLPALVLLRKIPPPQQDSLGVTPHSIPLPLRSFLRPGEITRGSCCLSSRMLFSCMFPTRLKAPGLLGYSLFVPSVSAIQQVTGT